MRTVVLGLAFVLAGAGCTGLGARSQTFPVPAPSALHLGRDPKPFSQVTIGQVQTLVPDGWRTFPSGPADDLRKGFVATPEPHAWQRMDGSAVGMAATWVDATQVGIPSDFYYLAATGPALSGLTHSRACRLRSRRVFVDDRPEFEAGPTGSPGDYVASGDGTCSVDGRLTRWTYFVAAPGFGRVGTVGIPGSGLYLVVIVMPQSHRVGTTLHRLLVNTHFGGAGIRDFVAAARAA